MTKTISINKAGEKLPTLIKNVKNNKMEYMITVNGEPAAVIISYAEWISITKPVLSC